jgi:hypothetical protein
MLLTAAVAHQALARRTLEVTSEAARVPAPVTRILREGLALLGPAAGLHDRVVAVGRTPGLDALGAMTVATSLAAPVTRGEPGTHAAGVMQRLRLAAHRQAAGEFAAGAPTMRAFAAVAITLLRRDLAASPRTGSPAEALMSAGRSWARLHAAWGEVRTLEPGDIAVLYDAATAVGLLDDPSGRSAWRTATTSCPAPDWLLQVASSLTETARRLAYEGPILVPTRWCEDADIPRPWTAAWPQHTDWLTGLHQATVRDSQLARHPTWTPTGRSITAAVTAVPSALARTS